MKGVNLITLYTIAPDVMVAKLGDMAHARNLEPRLYLEKLGRSVPAFLISSGWLDHSSCQRICGLPSPSKEMGSQI